MAQKITIDWSNGFHGILNAPNGSIKIGDESGQMLPYNLLFGALGSCFYATFIEIVEKKRLTLAGATMSISGTHREEVPTTLNQVTINLVIHATENQEKYLRSVELAQKYCSIYETVSKVATITVNVSFKLQ
jgi:putative redox protein